MDSNKYLELMKTFHELNPKNPAQNTAGFYVYNELSQANHIESIELDHSTELNLLFFNVKSSESNSKEIYVPILAMDYIQFDDLDKLQNLLCKNTICKEIILSIVDSSGIILHYKCTNRFLDLPELRPKGKT